MSRTAAAPAVSPAPSMDLDAILLTASNPSQAAAFRAEVQLRRDRGSLPPEERTRILVVCDPAGVRIGSGGATLASLHALLRSLPGSPQEQLAALLKMRIGMFHSGGDSQRLPTCSVRGKAFCGLPFYDPSTPALFESTPLDFLFACLSRLARAPGCIITATDCLFDFPAEYPPIEVGTPEASGVVGCAIETAAELGSKHGVYVLPTGEADRPGIGKLKDIMQKATQQELKAAGAISKNNTVLLDSGVVFMSPAAVAALLSLAEQAPFNTCLNGPEQEAALTEAAQSAAASSSSSPTPTLPASVSSKPKAFRFELYTDILLPMNPSMSLQDFIVSAPPDASYPKDGLEQARTMLWNALHPFTMYCAFDPRAQFFHMGTMPERMDFMYSQEERYVDLRKKHHFALQAHAVWDTLHGSPPPSCAGAAVLNSYFGRADEAVLETGSFVEYSQLSDVFHVGTGAVVSGLRSSIGNGLQLPAGMCIQETRLLQQWSDTLPASDRQIYDACARLYPNIPPPTVISVFHVDDAIKTPYSDAKARFLGRPFKQLLEEIARATGQTLDAVVALIWPGATSDKERTLWSAHVHPVHAHPCAVESIYPFTRQDEEHIRWMIRPSSEQDQAKLALTWSTWLQAPRLSFSNILAYSDVEAENAWRAEVAGKGDAKLLQDHLFERGDVRSDNELLPVILQRLTTTPESVRRQVASMLDDRALESVRQQTKLDVVGRILWIQAYLLRRAPAPAEAWSVPSDAATSELANLLRLSQPETYLSYLPRAIALLTSLRRNQSERIDPRWLLERYDAVCAAVGRCAVAVPSDTAFTAAAPADQLQVGDVVELQGCVRLDLFGGWTDTPPVTYEHGGAVLNVAVNVDGGYPIRLEAAVRPAANDASPLRVQFGAPDDKAAQVITMNELSNFADFAEPTAPAALIKCTLLAMGIIDQNDASRTLEQQLTAAFWSGRDPSLSTPIHLHLTSWIALSGSVAQGTGLGISSILAADLVLLLGRVFSRVYTPKAVTFLVLRIEQMLTTCGGWQDQVGGLWDGFKLTRSPRGLPLRLEVEQLQVDAKLAKEFEQHLVFIHTGMPRLAKNLLRTVLDAWSSRDPPLMSLFDRLEAGAPILAAAIQQGDWKEVGRLIAENWRIKIVLATSKDEKAPPAEPPHVAELIRRTEKLCYGATLAGAGGGGFLVLFAPPSSHSAISKILSEFNAENKQTECRMYAATVCAEEGSCRRMAVRKA